MEQIFDGIAGRLHICEPQLYVDNQARHRSGHMTHAMIEYAPGKVIAFNSNCSALRHYGHSAFGFIEYRYSEDAGKTWGEINVLPFSMQTLLDGVHTISVEKAVICDGVITLFLLRNTQELTICCEPWDTPLYIRSFDFGKTWTEPLELSPWAGRVYDAVVHDGSIFVMELCCPRFYALPAEQIDKDDTGCPVLTDKIVYRIYRSDDGGNSFHEQGTVDMDMAGHAYGKILFRKDGAMIAYSCNILNGYELGVSISWDCGKTWSKQPACMMKYGIRNVQIGTLDGKYVMHGRAFQNAPWGKGLVVYTSKDGLTWDDGLLLEPDKQSCYYSNNLTLKGEDGRERLLVQYSDGYDRSRVNVMHRWFYFD